MCDIELCGIYLQSCAIVSGKSDYIAVLFSQYRCLVQSLYYTATVEVILMVKYVLFL